MLEEKLKAEAKRLGFLLAGIAPAQPSAHFALYQQWLADGHQADMHYLQTGRALACRADPRNLMPGLRSILVTAWAYPPPAAEQEGAQVAAYAQGEDYHNVIPPRLNALCDWLAEQTGRTPLALAYTDTGPLLERSLAVSAGLGWIGKNSCLVSPQHGSFFFLAELLLDQPLTPDEPFSADRCGSCTRCIQACPTGCILPNRTLDSRRCLSYLTIENKGSIPRHLRPALGGQVFGCDICQQVCPWNQRSMSAARPADALNLLDELALTPQAFNLKYRHTPLQRARRRGYLRNLAVAIGNLQPPGALAALKACLQTEAEPLVRAHAAWAVSRLPGSDARALLQRQAQVETDPLVVAELQQALQTA